MMQMASMMRSAGLDPLAAPLGGSTPVAQGNPSAPSASNTTSTTTTPIGGMAPGGMPQAPNPFGTDPSSLLQLLGGVGGVSPSIDARPPEERFQVQLQVSDFVVHHSFGLTCIFTYIAIARHGFY